MITRRQFLKLAATGAGLAATKPLTFIEPDAIEQPEVAARPELRDIGRTTQLVVGSRPRLMRGVEVTNKLLDRPEDLQYLEKNLDMYAYAGVNTVLIPVTWQVLEPRPGRFNYTMIDALIKACRKRELMLIPLWFGSIKNGGLSYAPDWFKQDKERFFRAVRPDGTSPAAISPFCTAAMRADRSAFRHFMRHIKQQDRQGKVVVMVQVDNETGVITMSDQRDMSRRATKTWNRPVPDQLMNYLKRHDRKLCPWLQSVWDEHGKRTSGSWPKIFGSSASGQKIFMAYYMARYVGRIAQGGQQVYELPMYVNDWLGSLDVPGGPIGGPDFQLIDVWRAAAPGAFNIFAPDIYKDNFKAWCRAFDRPENPLLIPEAAGKHGWGRAGAHAWYALVQHDALLFSPYLNIGDEYHPDPTQSAPYFKRSHLDRIYPQIAGMQELILVRQGRAPRQMVAFLMDKGEPAEATYRRRLRGLSITATPRMAFPDKKRENEMVTPFAAVFWLRQNEYVLVGTKMSLTFSRESAPIRVVNAQIGQFVNSKWSGQNAAHFQNNGNGIITYNLPKGNLKIQEVRFRINESDGK